MYLNAFKQIFVMGLEVKRIR